MNLKEAKQRGCPSNVIKALKQAGITQLGFGLAEGEDNKINWTVVEQDLQTILKEADVLSPTTP